MGRSSSKFEAPMPQLPAMEPLGVVKACTTRTKPIRLEFGKKSWKGGAVEIRDADTGQTVFEAQKKILGKNQIRIPREGGQEKGKPVLNIHTRRSLRWKWDVKGDTEEEGHQMHNKPYLFTIECRGGNKPRFTIEFESNGQNVKWFVEDDIQKEKKHLTTIVKTQDETLIAHGGRHEHKSFPKSSGLVLTIAPGIDYAMIVAVFLCRIQYLEHRQAAQANSGVVVAAI